MTTSKNPLGYADVLLLAQRHEELRKPCNCYCHSHSRLDSSHLCWPDDIYICVRCESTSKEKRGWTLCPEAEWLGVLGVLDGERLTHIHFESCWEREPGNPKMILRWRCCYATLGHQGNGIGDTQAAALAAALVEAEGLEEEVKE